MIRRAAVRCALLILVGLPGLAAADTIVHAGALIDGRSNDQRKSVTLTIRANRIVNVVDGFSPAGADDTLIDLRDKTVLPGLIDLHTHLSYQFSAKSYQERFTLNDADFALRAHAYAQKTLRAGFTTVRDLGDTGNVTIALRNAINAGILTGPRIKTAAKNVATTGGHGDPTNGWQKDIAGRPGPQEGVINGPDEAREAVRQRYKDGADWIKITATGGVLSLAKSGQNPQFTDVELAALLATANDYGLPVAAHAHGAEGMKRAIIAGVKTIEHGTYMDDEVMRLMKKHGTYYVPTILAGNWVAEKAAIDGFFPEVVRPKAEAIGPKIKATFAAALRAGVPIAFGTDTGVSPHGENAREFALMVEAGMTPMDAIKSATSTAAKVLEMDADVGVLEAGKLADLIAVDDDPLSNIRTLESVPFVMKDGVVISR